MSQEMQRERLSWVEGQLGHEVIEAVRWMMAHEAGRRFVFLVLHDLCGIKTASFERDRKHDAQRFDNVREGQRSIAIALERLIYRVAPEYEPLMHEETAARTRKLLSIALQLQGGQSQ